jgi:purine-binding chemotaxis protein CheW
MLKRTLKSRQAKGATLSVMAFKVGHLRLAVTLGGIRKVIPRPQVVTGNQSFLGLTQVDDQEVLVLDLHHRILGISATEAPGFLIVFQSDLNTYGITTAELPTMQDIPLESLHPVPRDYRDRDALGIASQMAEIPLKQDETTTLFLLDPDELLSLVQSQNQIQIQSQNQTPLKPTGHYA